MSINVTVTGNPISIKRGKMVTSDSYQAKKEFDKRRLMRLEQVRQQSKDIAENVRNKVRKEKKKQMREIEEEGKQKLKNWQNRKLLELQTQYEGALQELGTGHKEAMDFIDESEILAEQKKINDKIATQRSQVAATELQIQKNKENLKKAIPVQQKKLVRDIENTRASLVSAIKKNNTANTSCSNKNKKRKKPAADISIIIPGSDSESSELGVTSRRNNSEEEGLSNVNEKDEPSTNSCDCLNGSDDTAKEPSDEADDSGPDLVSKLHRPISAKDREQVAATGATNLAKQIHDRRVLIEKFLQNSNNTGPPLDTRISDRIKRRDLMASQPDYCDTVAKTHPTPFIESNTQLRDAVDARNINNIPVEINCICGHKCPKICGKKLRDQHLEDESKIKFNEGDPKSKQTLPQELNIEREIPEKPPIKLKEKHGQTKRVVEPSKDTLGTYDSHIVKYYDHPNRFSQEKRFPSNAHVEKISGDSLEVVPDLISEEEWLQKMKQRDREAHIRGQKALEKEKIQKDYEEILKRLPLLQKKERIGEIAKDKQEYHMSDERLKERERKKQNDLDNAFIKLFPNVKPAVITLPSKTQEKETMKPVTDEPLQSLNIGNWDVDQEGQKMFTIEEVQEIVQAFTVQNPKDRRAKLKQLLRSLKLQKEQLINEIKSLPSNDSINELISDLKSVSDSDDRGGSRNRKRSDKSERKRKREHDKETSTDSTTESSSISSSKERREKKLADKQKGRHHSDTKTPSPRKKQKIKSKRKVLVLQNTSTQTTPKPSPRNDKDKLVPGANFEDVSRPRVALDVNKEEQKEKPVCPKLHIPCDCNKENESTEELCQIVIKINENEDPEVVVKSKEKNVKMGEDAVKEKSPKPSPRHKKETKSIGVGTEEVKRPPVREKSVDERVPAETKKSTDDKASKVTMKKHKTDSKATEQKRRVQQVDSSDSRAKSWKEQLSKNSISTTSTSYFSPPDFQKVGHSKVHSTINDEIKQSLYNLHKKPQQNNIRDFSSALSISLSSIDQRTVDPRLVNYIQKLLGMSRGSVENLTASSSSIQTPSQSVIEMESNNPLAQLHNIIKHYNLKDIESKLSYSPDFSPVPYNTSVSSSERSQLQPAKEKSADLISGRLSKSGKTDHSSKGTIDRETSSCSAKSKDSVFAQYAEITDSCSKRIAQLASMIEQLREEKIHLMQHPPAVDAANKTGATDKDYSTAYLELPGSNDSSGKFSSINSLDDEELQRRLLDIDFSLAEKLRKFTSTKQDKISDEDIDGKGREGPLKDTADEGNNTNTELWSRLQRLVQHEEQNIPQTSSIPTQTSKSDLAFVPFLSDIPKLPKLEVQPEKAKADSIPSGHKRPPPSKGLSVAKKFNGNISLVPHELSTIVEADSQLSTKLGSVNNSRTSQDISPRKDFELVVPEFELDIAETSASSKQSSRSNRASPSQVTKVSVTSREKCDDRCTDICSKFVATQEKSVTRSKTLPPSPVLNLSDGSNPSVILTSSKSSTSKKSIQLSSSSSDDMETIESMLRSIGMEWAIPTLHKTKEALALTSSSSSLELSAKKQVLSSSSSGGSEVSLKQFLKKQIKISSSTLKSDASPASFSPDLSELSSIQANNSNADKSNQKTSTPIISSKSTERSGKRVMFSADSDISSVREESQKHSDKSGKTSFRSLSEYSQSKSDI